MSSVDDRIVNMQFNNKQFVGGAQESEKALTSLEASLEKTAKSKGLEGLADSVQTVKTRFGAMQVAGVAAVATIASKATAAGLNLLKSLTIDPVLQGFQEYQTNLNSVQTIMANTGKSVGIVNRGLDQLNEYADKTIYNFSQMAKNVGTFTAAGVDLRSSISAIQGISNLAAASGSNAQQASTAMYQLSQAIAAGRVNLQDWNSVVNAGMGGKQFQLALTRTGEAMGTLAKGAAVLADGKLKIAGASFRDSISAIGDGPKWLTSEVLVQTLATLDGRFSKAALAADGLTDAQIKTSIAQARLNLAQEEGVKLTDAQFKETLKLADAAYNAATQIKTLPQLVGVVRESIGSTFSSIFRTVLGDFTQSKKLWGEVGDAIIGEKGFLTKAQDGLTGMFETWADSSDAGFKNMPKGFEAGMKLIDGGFERTPAGFDGRAKLLSALGSIVENLGRVFVRVKKAFQDIFPPGTDNILMRITDGFTAFAAATEITGKIGIFKDLRVTFQAFFAIIHAGMSILGGFVSFIKGFFDSIFQDSAKASGGLLSIVGDIARLIVKLDEFLFQGGKFQEVMGGMGEVVGAFVAPVIQAIGLIIGAIGALTSGEGLDGFFKNLDAAKVIFGGFSDSVESGLTRIFGSLDKFDGIGAKLADVFSFVPDMSGIGDAIVNGITEGLSSGAVTALKNGIVNLSTNIVAWFKEALGIHSPSTETQEVGQNIAAGIAVGISDGIIFVGKSIGNLVGAVLGGIAEGFGQFDPLQIASVLNALFTGALILTLRRFVKDIGGAITATAGPIQQLTDTFKTMQNTLRAATLMQIAIAVALLAGSLIALAFVPMEKMGSGLAAIATMMALLVGVFFALDKIMGKSKAEANIAVMSLAFISMATAVTMLSGALAVLALIPMEALGKGIGAIAALLGLMTGLMIVMAKSMGGAQVAAAAMIAMAFAINLLAAALAVLALIPADALAKGIGAVAQMLGLMTALMFALSPVAKTAPLAATGMIAMATAIAILTGSLVLLSAIPSKALGKAVGTLAFLLISLTLAMAGMAAAGPMSAVAAAGMIAIATALSMLLPLLIAFSLMSWEGITKALLGLTGILALLVIAAFAIGAVATAVGPGLLAFGYAVALVGAGMLAFGTGFALMAAAGVAGVAVLTAAFGAFISFLPTIGIQLAAMFVSFFQTLGAMAPKLRKAFGQIFEAILGTIRDAIPHIADLLITLVNEGIRVMRETVPQWIELGWFLLDSFLQSIADHLPNIVDSATTIVTTLLGELGNNALEMATAALDFVLDLAAAVTDAINDAADELGAAGLALAGAILNGMTGGLAGRAGGIVGDLVGGIGDGLGAIGGLLGRGFGDTVDVKIDAPELRNSGREVVKAITKGIKESASEAVAAVIDLATTIIAKTSEAVAVAQRAAFRQQAIADSLQSRADAANKAANKLKKAGQGKASKEYQRMADRAQAAADREQARADAQAQRVADIQAFESASLLDKSQMRSDLAVDLAEKAQAALADANANAALAKKLAQTNQKLSAQLLKQSKEDAAKAKRFAEEARKAERESLRLGIAALEEENALRKKQEDFEKMSDAEKIAALDADAAAQQAKADAQRAEALRLLNLAKKYRLTDAKKAQQYLDQANKAADLADAAAQAAEDAKSAAESLRGNTANSPAGAITPSRTVLEDAASSVDRYTASLAQAQELAGAASVIQFEQNNYSPEALNPTEIYRQSKNLLSNAELKIAEIPIP